jgi:glycosyltransferase involved in cell wall biosynthesis
VRGGSRVAALIPRVSVVLPVHNGGRFLAEAVESVLGQTLRDLELVVVDDGSTDETPRILERYSDPRLRVVRRPHLGLVEALNRGVRESRTPYVARMDADDVSLPGRLERQVAVLEARPRVGLVGTWLTVIDEAGNKLRAEVLPDADADLRRRLMLRNSFKHGSVMLRCEVLDRVGPYRNDYGNNEDYDLWRRIAAVAELACVPEALYVYREHPLGVSKTNEVDRVAQRERLRAEIWAACSDSAYGVVQTVRNGRRYRRDRTPLGRQVYREFVADQRALAREAHARGRPVLGAKALAASMLLAPGGALRRTVGLVRKRARPSG